MTMISTIRDNLGMGSISVENGTLSDLIHKDGTVEFTANQSMGNHTITNVSDGANSKDAVNFGQLDGAKSYTVWSSSNWNGTTPTTIADALHRIESWISLARDNMVVASVPDPGLP